MSWETDTEFEETKIDKTTKEGDGYTITTRDGTLWVPDPGFVPTGKKVRFYGRGLGFPVRGVVVDGRVVYYRTRREQDAKQKEESQKWKAKQDASDAVVKASGRSEAAMRDEKAPWPKTVEELTAYIQKQVDGPHDYGTCVYAMSLAATAAFNYVASALGTTGFQAGCADFDILRRTRNIKGPMMLLDAEKLLYPQYDLRKNVEEWLTSPDMQKWCADEARRKMAESPTAHPDVLKRWKELAR